MKPETSRKKEKPSLAPSVSLYDGSWLSLCIVRAEKGVLIPVTHKERSTHPLQDRKEFKPLTSATRVQHHE